MGNDQASTLSGASAGRGSSGDETPGRAGVRRRSVRKFWTDLGRFLRASEPHRNGVYLPLVRVDGRD